jgi:hypothetical protein
MNLISIEHDPVYDETVEAISIVKQFIRDNKLIIYGGTAIDFALRLCGDKIYSDATLQVPDLDFFSPDNVEHAYKLADLIYKLYKEVRAINALHTTTMKVDLIDNHYIADISYVPIELFNKLPFLEYENMRVIHPNYQRLDIHLSLSFPYVNAPREAFFERWAKDIKRFNLLDKYYPIVAKEPKNPTVEVILPAAIKQYVFSGFAAYYILKYIIEKNDNFSINADCIKYKVPKLEDCIVASVVHLNPEKILQEFTNVTGYNSYFNLLLERYEVTINEQKMTIYSTKNKLISINSIKIQEYTLRIVNIQFLLQQFLAMYFISLNEEYLSYYVDLINMINKTNNDLLKPSVIVYGNENISTSAEIALNRVYNDIDNVDLFETPYNYYPINNAKTSRPHPIFNMNNSKFYQINGDKKIEKNSL